MLCQLPESEEILYFFKEEEGEEDECQLPKGRMLLCENYLGLKLNCKCNSLCDRVPLFKCMLRGEVLRQQSPKPILRGCVFLHNVFPVLQEQCYVSINIVCMLFISCWFVQAFIYSVAALKQPVLGKVP